MGKLSLTIAIAGALCAGAPAASAAELLITAAEAARPASADLGFATRGLTRGPRIEQLSPDPRGKSIKSPFSLEIRFRAHNEMRIDPNSVKVTYLKSPSVDLTPRLKGHITAGGIDMSDAEVPPGTHLIRIEVVDTDGRKGSSIIKLSVLP